MRDIAAESIDSVQAFAHKTIRAKGQSSHCLPFLYFLQHFDFLDVLILIGASCCFLASFSSCLRAFFAAFLAAFFSFFEILGSAPAITGGASTAIGSALLRGFLPYKAAKRSGSNKLILSKIAAFKPICWNL